MSCETLLQEASFYFLFLIIVICITFTRGFIVKLSEKTWVKNWVMDTFKKHRIILQPFWMAKWQQNTWFSSLWKLTLPVLEEEFCQEAQHNKCRRPETGRHILGEESMQRREENLNKNTSRQAKINFRQDFHH